MRIHAEMVHMKTDYRNVTIVTNRSLQLKHTELLVQEMRLIAIVPKLFDSMATGTDGRTTLYHF